MWHGPMIPTDPVLRESVRIAMGYLREIGQADDYRKVELAAAGVILEAYRDGVRGAVRNVVGIRLGEFSGNMKLSFQAARSIG